MTGRGLNRIGAHNTVANSTYQGICFILGGSQQPTANQLKGFRDMLVWLRARGVNTNNIRGHRDHISTSCPGTPLYNRVRSGNWGAGGSTPSPSPTYSYWTVAGIQIPTGTPSFREGTSGTHVSRLQAGLNKWRPSLNLSVDGDFGPITTSALRTFQSARGIGVDGVYGPGSASALRTALGGSNSTPTPTPTGEFLDVANFRTFNKDLSDLQNVPNNTWTNVKFGEDSSGGGQYSIAFAGEKFIAGVGVSLVLTLPEGVDAKGREFQGRFAQYRENPNANQPGEPNWIRARGYPITAPVHDGGKMHFTQTWPAVMPPNRRLRFEVIHFLGDDVQVQVETARADVFYN